MNRILLAYCHDNAELAYYLDHKLSRIGIPFEHITEQPETPMGAFAEHLRTNEEPVLLLVTDNLLKNRACMVGLLPLVQQLVRQERMLAVVADGLGPDGAVVPTHIDRMVNALQYMNYWQNTWLELSTAHQQAAGAEKEALDEELDQVRNIANQMGDLISAFREAGYSTQEQLESQDFALFFQKFGLTDWHGQYRRLAALDQEVAGAPESIAPATMAEVPVLTGMLAPTPAEPLDELIPEGPPILPEQSPAAIAEESWSSPEAVVPDEDFLSTNPAWPEAEAETRTHLDPEAEIETTVRDAWFWLERGHTERGLELFQLALEQHPEQERLRNEYALALEKYQPAMAEASAEPLVEPVPEAEVIVAQEQEAEKFPPSMET
ncbi:MAG: hypothetical protein ABIQ93_00165, partial [Saprospiraceae bacterium]